MLCYNILLVHFSFFRQDWTKSEGILGGQNMKKLLRNLALFLALTMALSVGAVAAEEDGPQLVMNHLEWNEEGRCFISEEALSPEHFESEMDYWPGRSDAVIFFILDGGKKTPVVPAGKGIAVRPMDKESIASGAEYSEYYVYLLLDKFQNASVTTTSGGKALTFPVTASLPLEGFYFRPELKPDAIYDYSGDASALEDMTIYFGLRRNDGEHGSHVVDVKPAGDTDRYAIEEMDNGFWKIVLDFEGGMEVRMEITLEDTEGNTWTEEQSQGFWLDERQGAQLWLSWLEGGEYIFLPDEAEIYGGFQPHPGEYPLLIFYTVDGIDEEGRLINPQPVPFDQLEGSEGVSLYAMEQHASPGDPLAECYVQVDVAGWDSEYTISTGEYVMHFDSYLPDISVYFQPEATIEAWAGSAKYAPFHTDQEFYILSTCTFDHYGRELVSLELETASSENLNRWTNLEDRGNGIYAFSLKEGVDFSQSNRIQTAVTWKDAEGRTWTDNNVEFWIDSCPSVVASQEPFITATEETVDKFHRTSLGKVSDKISASLTMTAGEDLTAYLGRIMGDIAEREEDWMVVAAPPIIFYTSDSALTLIPDANDAAKYTLRCDKPGEYEIRLFAGFAVRFRDTDGEVMEQAAFEKAWEEFMESSGGISRWDFNWKTNEASFYDLEGKPIACPYKTAIIPGKASDWFPVKVTVESGKSITELYPDITNENAWYVPAVQYVTRKGMMNGTGEGFAPGAEITGAMFVQILYNIEGQPGAGSVSFQGVDSQWYAAPVTWAAEKELITDTGDAALNPAGSIARQQMALILYNYMGRPSVSGQGELDFADADQISSWALDAVKWAVSVGVLNGSQQDGKLYLDPTGAASRAVTAQILMNYFS